MDLKNFKELDLPFKLKVSKEGKEPVILVMDYAFGEQAYETMDELLKPTESVEESEEIMLDLYCKRAGVQDGMKVVDLGCGWGSLTLYLCEKFPNAKITSISNSNSQREFIYADAKRRGLNYQNIKMHKK